MSVSRPYRVHKASKALETLTENTVTHSERTIPTTSGRYACVGYSTSYPGSLAPLLDCDANGYRDVWVLLSLRYATHAGSVASLKR
jgi:hypothetical protein